jgi:UDP-glucuronate 4-epimerase
MNILVTGGAGFIGSHLAEALLRRGDRVTIVDDLDDFYPPALKRENLAEVARAGEAAFELLDICDEERVFRLFEERRFEAVVHLAARAGVRPSLLQPLLYERVNVYGTTVLLEAARRTGVRRFVFASSSSVYGVADRVPFTEEDSANRPISPYAATKIAGEKLCYTFSHLYAIDVVCLRFFTVYGPRQRPDLAIRKFVGLIEAGRPIPIFGGPTSRRDYTYVDDIVAGVVAALDLERRYEIINLGSSSPVDLSTLIATIEEALGKKAVLEILPAQAGDVPVTYADVSKAGRLLGFSPRTTLADGVRRFVEWLRARP